MIYTFYSFKGGVGRSMALANLAEYFYRKGLQVLAVDFDLEAPGLERFFAPQLSDEMEAINVPDPTRTAFLEKVWKQRGVIDMALSFKALHALPFGSTAQQTSTNPITFDHPVEPLVNFIYPIYAPEKDKPGALYLIPAGRRTTEEYGQYTERVRTFDWDDFYINYDGGKFFDWLRKEILSLADVVLVDSRTGITEMTGICTYHLADNVVILVAPNEQNLEGISIIAQSLQRRQKAKPEHNLQMLIIPSRVELTESPMLARFKKQFMDKLGGYNSPSLDPSKVFDELGIPYVARYAYFEKLAMREPDHPVAAKINPFYEKLAQAMWNLAPKDSAFYRRYYQGTRPALTEIEVAPPLDPDFTGRQWVFTRLEQWIADADMRFFLIKGEPGSGKTALAARLWQMSRGDIETGGFPRLGSGTIQFVHFCSPGSTDTLTLVPFIDRLASTLAGLYQDFTYGLIQGSDKAVNVNVRQTVEVVGQGAQVIGVKIDSIQVKDLLPEERFKSLLARPLETLCSRQPETNILILIDGLDASLEVEPSESLLEVFHWIDWLPQQVRFIVTSRDDLRVLSVFDEKQTTILELDGESNENQTDVALYIQNKLSGLMGMIPEDLIEKTTSAAQGNFLYARSLMDSILENPTQSEDILLQTIPQSLAQVFSQYLKTNLAGKTETWNQRDGRLLSLLVAAKGEGLTAKQLAGILNWQMPDTDDCLRSWSNLLEYNSDTHTFQFFHPAFRDYLLTNPEYPVFPYEANRDIAGYFYKEWAGRWSKSSDAYALHYTPWHLTDALLITPSRKEKQELTNRLAQLLADVRFRQVKATLFGEGRFKADLTSALEVIPAGHPAYQEIVELARRMSGEQLESVPRILVNWQIEDHNPEEPLQKGELYTLTLSLEDQRSETQLTAVPSELPQEVLDETLDISIDLFSQDFNLVTSRQVLRLPRMGRARGRARFDIEPLHEGECTLHVLISRQGSILQSITSRYTVGKVKKAQPPSISVSGRELAQAFQVPRRDILLTIVPESNGYRMMLTGIVPVSVFIPKAIIDQMKDELIETHTRFLQISITPLGKHYPFRESIDIPQDVTKRTLMQIAEVGAGIYRKLFYSSQADTALRRFGDLLQEITRKESIKIQIVGEALFSLPWNILCPAKVAQKSQIDPENFLGFRHVIEQLPLQYVMPVFDSRIPLANAEIALTIGPTLRRRDLDLAEGLIKRSTRWETDYKIKVWQRNTSQEVVEALTNTDNHDELVYFNCNITPEKIKPGSIMLPLNLGSKQRVDIKELITNITTPFNGQPLFILNIPFSNQFSSYSLVSALLNRGARACIAPQLPLPDIFCADWGVRFFERLLKGEPVGQAMLAISREYLYKHNNPLGLVYGCFGDADTHFVLPPGSEA